MKKLAKISLGILIITLFTGCPEELPEVDKFIILINNSDEDIVWYGINNFVTSDTSNVNESFPWRDVEDYKIAKGDTFYYGINVDSFRDLIDDGWEQYYFLNYDTVLTVPWERIRDENIILKKVYFETWEDLEACNFTITYP